ncbi:MAG: hypothetical protein R3B41_01880 [Candidatus Doudnabacteria bacterium]
MGYQSKGTAQAVFLLWLFLEESNGLKRDKVFSAEKTEVERSPNSWELFGATQDKEAFSRKLTRNYPMGYQVKAPHKRCFYFGYS